MAYEDDQNEEYDIPTLFRHSNVKTKQEYSQMSTSVAKERQNLQLNRYNNVSPNDKHRAILESYNNNDYINASIARSSSDSIESGQVYILAQGPLPGTCFDTWRMVWQYGSRAIIMLNRLVEQGKNKCHRYWPEQIETSITLRGSNNSTDLYFTITLKGETPHVKRENETIFIVRDLEVTRFENDVSVGVRQIKHFHYTAWPDFGVPATPVDFVEFYDKLQDYKCFTNPSSPSVVHCSAGIGRTGTLCLVDSLLKQLQTDPQRKHRIIDLYHIVDTVYDELIFMRQFRLGLIQTAEQLEFCLKAIKWLHNRSVKSNLERLNDNSLDNKPEVQQNIESDVEPETIDCEKNEHEDEPKRDHDEPILIIPATSGEPEPTLEGPQKLT